MIVTTERSGMKTLRIVPDDAPRETWSAGVVVGPPSLQSLGLPEEVLVRLHSELFSRGIIRRGDARTRRADVHAALMAALRVDAESIITIYEMEGNDA